jgi:voltage-gated potassium channel
MSSSQGTGSPTPVVGLLARRLLAPTIAAIVTVVVASAGYVALEGWGLLDAVYMSVITIGQVGFNEVHPLDSAGRWWTMVVIFSGFAVFVYSAATLTAVFLSGDVAAAVRERRRSRVRQNLRDHVVVIGFGRVGRSAADAALHTGHDCVVIDTDPASEQAVESMGAVFLHGDARDVTVLRHANVAHAAALITTLEDPSNAVVSLTARSLSPTLRIVARVADVTWSERLLRAGASHVVPVYESIGAGLAATALDAEVISVLPIPGTEMRVEEMEIGAGSRAEGNDLSALMGSVPDVHILGLRHDGGVRRWHEAEGALHAGDMLVVLGNAAGLSRLTALVRHGSVHDE